MFHAVLRTAIALWLLTVVAAAAGCAARVGQRVDLTSARSTAGAAGKHATTRAGDTTRDVQHGDPAPRRRYHLRAARTAPETPRRAAAMDLAGDQGHTILR